MSKVKAINEDDFEPEEFEVHAAGECGEDCDICNSIEEAKGPWLQENAPDGDDETDPTWL